MTTVQELIALLSEPEVVNALVEQFAETGTKVSELTPLADPAGTDLSYIVDVSAGVAGSKSIDLDTLFGNVPSALTLKQATGVTVDPGSDVDAVVASLVVTGTPTIGWSEISDAFTFTHDVAFSGSIRAGDGGHIGVPVSTDAQVSVDGSLYYSTNKGTLTYRDGTGNAAPISKTIQPSGDATGVTDLANIQAAIDNDLGAALSDGQFYINDSINLNVARTSVTGAGTATRIENTNAAVPCIAITASFVSVAGLQLVNGLTGITNTAGKRITISMVEVNGAVSHGVDLGDESWLISINQCTIHYCGGDGIHAVGRAGAGRYLNALTITDCFIENCSLNGIHFENGAGLNVTGNCIEGNTQSGILLSCEGGNTTAVNITGNYFEGHGVASIEIATYPSYLIEGGTVTGNYSQEQTHDVPFVYAHDSTTLTGRCRNYTFDATNQFDTPTLPNYPFLVDSVVRSSIWDGITPEQIGMQDAYVKWQTQRNDQQSQTRCAKYVVECNADRVGNLVSLLNLDAGTIIQEVSVKAIEAFTGTTTTTFEVGVSVDTDKYINIADFDPSAYNSSQFMTDGTASQNSVELMVSSRTITCEWTNTGGAPTAGKVEVRILYSRNTGTNVIVAVDSDIPPGPPA